MVQNDVQQVKPQIFSLIFVEDVENFKLIVDKLSKIIGLTNFSYRSFTKNDEIQSTKSDSYRKTIF